MRQMSYMNDYNLPHKIQMTEETPRKQNLQMTPQRTPIGQHRPYLSFHQSQSQMRRDVNPYHHSEQPHMIEEIYEDGADEQDQRVIWGTNIATEVVIKGFEKFFQDFEVILGEDEDPQKIYLNRLLDYDLDMNESNLLQIDARHIKEWEQDLYNQLIYYPAEIICILDKVVQDLYEKLYIANLNPQDYGELRITKQTKKDRLMVSIKHLSDISVMRSLQEKHINRLISFRGIVIRCSDIYPQMKTATFQCIRCKAEIPIDLIDAKVQQPKICVSCQSKETFLLIHKHCHFTDKQFVKIQELPEYVPEGQTPTSMNVLCYDNNVNGMRPGDRVEIVGLYRCQGRKVTRLRSNMESVFQTYSDIISYRILEENRFKASLGDAKTTFSEEEKDQFFKIASSQDVIDDLVNSFAGSISGNQSIKRGLLTQIFGGTHKEFEGRGRFRSDINICLVGDPSTAKSQFLKQVHAIAPRGIYTSGKSSSAVGLTANVRRDPQSGEFVLESGALVLSDLGICCIDEFDKMDENSKLILLEAMEQQTISVAKAGIVCQLNSRTSILSAANPVLSKYDMKRSVVENINLPPALLSRFDLIYIILDIPNEKLDRKLAEHILSLFSGKSTKQLKREPKIPRSLMAKYITYAREYIMPKLSERAAKRLTDCYLEMRGSGHRTKTVSATPRQLQSLIRISQAFAKMKLSAYVQEDEVNMAFELIKDALKQSATDPNTGVIDMDVIVTGHTSASRRRVELLVKLLNDLFQANPSEYKGKNQSFDKLEPHILQNWKAEDYSNKPKEEEIREALQKLDKEGIIRLFGNNKHRPMFSYIGHIGHA